MARILLIILVAYFSIIYADDTQCGNNESWNLCGRMCEPTCPYRKPNKNACPRIQCTESTSACRCNKRFWRNSETGQCVRAEKCPRNRKQRSTMEQYELVCGDNEQIGNCGRTCEGTCSNPNVTHCPNCSNNGCQCKKGYLRNEETDTCVPTWMCPRTSRLKRSRKEKKCKRGEIMGACGTKCEGTCESPRQPEICQRIRCSDRSCRCDLASGEPAGNKDASVLLYTLSRLRMARFTIVFLALVVASYAQSYDGICDCNEELNLCGRICEPTCRTRKPNPLLCPRLQCTNSTKACRCKKGYYRDSLTKLCVLPVQCPVTTTTTTPSPCGVNEQLGNCGRMCEKTCSNSSLAQCAATSCAGSGCQCENGYVRNEATDQCVKPSKCPEKCAEGEIRAACGKTCEGTCQKPRTPEICSRIRCSNLDCRCDLSSGYVRNATTNECVQIGQCQTKEPVCPANSAPKQCGRFCEPTCRNPQKRACKVDASKCTVDCRCLDGFVRNEKTRECVRPSTCCEYDELKPEEKY
ncbi:zonadhesin-like [Venturia canescens]|uniref:zonadhesin-like n=1 Tax=Venturia canescens TaxID=32260 RepID=UPI001C9CA3EE|nr:zonadhesin-like [Venturia canescens]